MTGQTIRDTFVSFYTDRGHTSVRPAPLVPRDDPTLMFNSAGMVQFKNHYVTSAVLPYVRAVSVQPCLRAGGKDSDLENVGHTPRHLSFFEMLGNFSFGDYFKEDAIQWGWELLTKSYGLDPDRLWVTVYDEDDEAADIWVRAVDFPRERIVKLGKKDNFWGPAGKTGACGPCSEIHFDLAPDRTHETLENDDDRFIEVYNLVFPQFDMQEDGTLAPLRNRGIDTGMGLERLALVIQGGETVFDTDLFTPMLDRLGELTGVHYAEAPIDRKRAMRVVVDHVRGLTFAITEGVMPSNEGRGYVLRRILRRAVRRGWNLGLEGAFMREISDVVITHYEQQYPFLAEAGERVGRALASEEERFATTLGTGMRHFDDAVAAARKAGATALSGDAVFSLYDTYGFPVDLIEEIAEEKGIGVDVDGFDRAMASQKARSRAASKFDGGDEEALDWRIVSDGDHSEFTGYTSHDETVRVRRYAVVGDAWWVVLDRTPFYAESGGQVGDAGTLSFGDTVLPVSDTIKRDGAWVHVVAPPRNEGPDDLFAGEGHARVDVERRAETERNHTATHLLHAALRHTLGTHVTQAGSLVAPDRLRFDFTHFQPLSPDELRAIEREVADEVLNDTRVDTETTSIQEALDAGAMALFGEKYGDEVRQVIIGGYSRELCGGTHVGATGEVGPFLIVSESAVAAGTRRVEALTGRAAAALIRRDREAISGMAHKLQVTREEVETKLDSLIAEKAHLEKELSKARDEQRRAALGKAMDDIEEVDGVRLIVRRVDAANPGDMRASADVLRDQLGSGVAILGADVGGKASFLVLVTKDLVAAGRFRADEIVRAVARIAGGSGGGKPDMALAGAKEVGKIGAALDHGRELVKKALAGA